MDKVLAADFADEGIKVPIMLVHSLWDQEDIYGAPAVYKAIKPLDKDNDKVFLVLGPWHHGQEIEDAASLGAIRFGSDTGTWFRQNVLAPFLDRYLKDDAPAASDSRPRHRLRNRPQTMAEACRLASAPGHEAALSRARIQAQLRRLQRRSAASAVRSTLR